MSDITPGGWFGLGYLYDTAKTEYMIAQQDRQAREAYERQIDFWNMQNEYNSPSAQVERLKQAGLNPGAVLGGAVENQSSNLSSVPQAQAGSQDYLKSGSAVPNLALQYAQIEKLNAETEAIRGETKGQSILNDLNSATLPDKIRYQALMNSHVLADTLGLESHRRLMDRQAQVEEMKYRDLVWQETLRELKRLGLEKQNNLTDAQIDNLKAIAYVYASEIYRNYYGNYGQFAELGRQLAGSLADWMDLDLDEMPEILPKYNPGFGN